MGRCLENVLFLSWQLCTYAVLVAVVKPVKTAAHIRKDRVYKLHLYLRSSWAAMEGQHSVLKRGHWWVARAPVHDTISVAMCIWAGLHELSDYRQQERRGDDLGRSQAGEIQGKLK